MAFQFTPYACRAPIAPSSRRVSLFSRAEAVFKFCMDLLVRLFVYSLESGVVKRAIIYDQHGCFGRRESERETILSSQADTDSDNKRWSDHQTWVPCLAAIYRHTYMAECGRERQVGFNVLNSYFHLVITSCTTGNGIQDRINHSKQPKTTRPFK